MAHTPVGHYGGCDHSSDPVDKDNLVCRGAGVAPDIPPMDHLHRQAVSRLHRRSPTGRNRIAELKIHILTDKILVSLYDDKI